MSLRDRANTAKSVQSFKDPVTKPKPKKEPPAADQEEPEQTPLSANDRARKLAGVDEPRLSRSERQARRRATIAQLVVELTPEQKAELLRSAKENQRSLKAEVLDRLGF